MGTFESVIRALLRTRVRLQASGALPPLLFFILTVRKMFNIYKYI